jgi:hypothetical protein
MVTSVWQELCINTYQSTRNTSCTRCSPTHNLNICSTSLDKKSSPCIVLCLFRVIGPHKSSTPGTERNTRTDKRLKWHDLVQHPTIMNPTRTPLLYRSCCHGTWPDNAPWFELCLMSAMCLSVLGQCDARLVEVEFGHKTMCEIWVSCSVPAGLPTSAAMIPGSRDHIPRLQLSSGEWGLQVAVIESSQEINEDH